MASLAGISQQRFLGVISNPKRMHVPVPFMRHFCGNNNANDTWFRSRFAIPQDTRIIPQVIFASLTFVFSIIALRMSYTGFYWAEKHAATFNNRFDRMCELLEEQSNKSTQQNKNVTNINIKGNADEIEELQKEIWELIESHFNYDQDDIKCKV